MSRIYDALKRSENEGDGEDLLTAAQTVTELLQAAESRYLQQAQAVVPAIRTAMFEPRGHTVRVSATAESRLVCLTDPGSLGAEKFRVLGLRLRNLRDKRKLKRVVVTGTAPEEGKSLIAANLALNQSRSRLLKTLLLDGDFRRPMLAKRFGIDESLPGLSEHLHGQCDLAEVVYKLEGPNLWLLPSGSVPENPLELMQSGRLPECLDILGTFFDWIIIDTPPMFPLADTAYWMKQSDGVLLVVREEVSDKKLLSRAVETIDRSTLLGVVVNSCRSAEQHYYYSRYKPETAK